MITLNNNEFYSLNTIYRKKYALFLIICLGTLAGCVASTPPKTDDQQSNNKESQCGDVDEYIEKIYNPLNYLARGVLSISPVARKELKNGDIANAHRRRVDCFRAEAGKGNASSQFNLGAAYYYGEGVKQDFTEAARWFRESANNGNVNGQFATGVCHEKGQGVVKNYNEAIKWYRKAADQGNVTAPKRIEEINKILQEIAEEEKLKNDRAQKLIKDREEYIKGQLEKARIFRKTVQVGSETNCGPVIDIRDKLIKIYFPVKEYGNEHWIKKEQLFPPGYGCYFYNGQYEPPIK
ncbi:MAG: sel1 repeat family protein [Magnetococcales bacterium]|nr:sel1 repeat family protein [Magnetococcales bacterium]NGZ25400.1 sel1 repeat family protein [Magnetococcales bacterium]